MEDITENPKKDGLNMEKPKVERNPDGTVKPGSVLNPNGKPVGLKSFTTKVREALSKIAEGKNYTYEEAFIKSILKKGILDGDPSIIKLMWNYLDGTPLQRVNIGEDSENPFKGKISDEEIDKIIDRYAIGRRTKDTSSEKDI